MQKHTAKCIENAEISVRENCAASLTADIHDATAMKHEAEWVSAWAEEWLTDGTSTCICGI